MQPSHANLTPEDTSFTRDDVRNLLDVVPKKAGKPDKDKIKDTLKKRDMNDRDIDKLVSDLDSY